MGDLLVCGDDGGQGCAVEFKTNSKKSEFGPMIGHKATKCQQYTVATTTMTSGGERNAKARRIIQPRIIQPTSQ